MTKITYYKHPIHGKFKLIERPLSEYAAKSVYCRSAAKQYYGLKGWRGSVYEDRIAKGKAINPLHNENIQYMVFARPLRSLGDNDGRPWRPSLIGKRNVVHFYHEDYDKILTASVRKFQKYLRKHKDDEAR